MAVCQEGEGVCVQVSVTGGPVLHVGFVMGGSVVVRQCGCCELSAMRWRCGWLCWCEGPWRPQWSCGQMGQGCGSVACVCACVCCAGVVPTIAKFSDASFPPWFLSQLGFDVYGSV